jgi:nitroreductase
VTDLDLETVDRLLTTTRAVRKRLDRSRAVPRAAIEECLRLAVQAPTAGDAQNWHWVVVSDRGRRRAVADIYRADNEEYVRRELAAAEDARARRRLVSTLSMIEHLHDVPVHVLAYVLDPRLQSVPVPPPVLYGSIFPAVWSFQLALRSRGLGTTPLYVANDTAVAQLVGAPADARLASVLPVAYYTGDTFRPASRRPLAEVVSWDTWERAG